MNLNHITDALYRQSLTYGQESRIELEAQLETNNLLLIQAGTIMVAVRRELENALKGLAKISEMEYGGLVMVGEADFSALSRQWKLVDETHARYTEAGSVVCGMRERNEDIMRTLADKKLWECATSTDKLTRSLAWSRIRETK